MKEIKASSYSVFVSNDCTTEINTFVKNNKDKFSKIFLLVDENSLQYCYPKLAAKVKALTDAEIIEIESGEENKNIEICVQVWSTLSERAADRQSLLINIGGGVIGDMGGFIASTFKRGIPFINIPTTLLSQVDASVGGKLGIDLNHLKNEIGVFNNPQAVFVDSSFLSTLDKRQVLSGFAEIIKHALIADATYWKKIKSINFNSVETLAELIETSVTIKNKVVLADPFEKNIRKTLNFGHTIGHAIETHFLETKDALLHGEAIAIGMICEGYLSNKIAGLSDGELDELTEYILSVYQPVKIPAKIMDALLKLMQHDKKNEKGQLNFSLLSAIGKCEINQLATTDLIQQSINYYTEQVKKAEMNYRVSHPSKKLIGSIELTASKSESNRALIIQALCSEKFEIKNLAAAEDTTTLQRIILSSKLKSPKSKVDAQPSAMTYDVGAAGTTMRFLTAYFSITPGTHILTGSERMKNRPIGILVSALRELGADIEYMEKEGFPPLKIKGREPEGSFVEIDGSVSSQYVSALLLIAPQLKNGLQLRFKGEATSRPYINMTLKMMEEFGVNTQWQGDTITVNKQSYNKKSKDYVYEVEGDWSSASYWYAIATLSTEVGFTIKGLNHPAKSLQGDAAVAEIFSNFGIRTEYINGAVRLIKAGKIQKEFQGDFSNCPDLAQTVATVVSALQIPSTFTGLHTLRIKETDRTAALKNELAKLGTEVTIVSNEEIKIKSGSIIKNPAPIATYEDHRMAMAFAVFALTCNFITIQHPEVVKKSYPDFWSDLKKTGFVIDEV